MAVLIKSVPSFYLQNYKSNYKGSHCAMAAFVVSVDGLEMDT